MGKPSIIVVQSEQYKILSERFYQHQVSLGYSEQSCKTQRNRLNEFLEYAEVHFSDKVNAVTTANIITFYKHIQARPSRVDGRKLNLKTVGDFIRVVVSFYSYLQEEGQVKENPANVIELLKPKQTTIREALSELEISKLYQYAVSHKERAILALSYGCGLRVSEIVACNINDIKLREKLLIVKQGKNKKSRIIPLSNKVSQDISIYLTEERLASTSKIAQESPAFILHHKEGRMQSYTYNKILKQLIARCDDEALKVKQIGMHHLRHSIATHLIVKGVPLEKVSAFLGHSQIETTQCYTHISQEQLSKLV